MGPARSNKNGQGGLQKGEGWVQIITTAYLVYPQTTNYITWAGQQNIYAISLVDSNNFRLLSNSVSRETR